MRKSILIFFYLVFAAEVSAQLTQQDSIVTLSNGVLTVNFNLNTGFWEGYLEGERVFHNAYAAVKAAPVESSLGWMETFRDGYLREYSMGRVTDHLGAGTQVIFTHHGLQGALDLELILTLYDGQPLLTALLKVENPTDTTYLVRELHPLETSPSWNGAMYFGTDPTHCLVLENEYISWWTCKLTEIRNGTSSKSHWNNLIYDRTTGKALVIGFLTQQVTENIIYLKYSSESQPLPGRRGFGEFLVNCRSGNYKLAPGDSLVSDRVMLYWSDQPLQALEQYAEWMGKFQGVQLWPEIPAGWCSWYYYYWGVSEADVIANLNFIADKLRSHGMEYVQIDDGFQRALGDWETNDKFPHGHRWLTDQIHSKGLKAGLWLAPFGIGEKSDVYRNHPEWLIKDGDGNPIRVNKAWANPYWGGDVYALDPTHPEAQQWLRNLFHTVIHDWGYDYVKIDFLYYATGADQGEADNLNCHYYANVTPIQAYRIGLQAIREGVGADKFILGCGAPIGASVGLVDGMRIGTDVYPSWGQIAECAKNVARRYFLHNRVFLNDPDVVMVRTQMPETQAKAWASMVALTGTMTLDSDKLPSVPDSRIAILKKILPVYSGRFRPLDLLEAVDEPPSIWDCKVSRNFEEWHVVGLVNWKGRTERISLDTRQLGWFGTPCLAFDFWDKRFLGEFTSELVLEVPPNSCKVIALHQKRAIPQILSTSRHITQGGVDLQQVWWDADSLVLRGTSQGVAGEPYKLYLHVPKEPGLGYRFSHARADVPQFSAQMVSSRILELSFTCGGDPLHWAVYFAPGKIRIIEPEEGGSYRRDVSMYGLCAPEIDSVEIRIDGQRAGRAEIIDGQWHFQWRFPRAGEFLITAIGYEAGSSYSDQVEIKVLSFTKDVLIVDDTRDGIGALFGTREAEVDSFYHRLFHGLSCDEWDLRTQGLPQLFDLGDYSFVCWHMDNFIDQQLAGAVPQLRDYLNAGGKLLLCGLKLGEALAGDGTYPYTFEPGDFTHDFLHLRGADDDPNADFLGARGLNGYPDVWIDPGKPLSAWNGRLKFVEVLMPVEAQSALTPIYTFLSASGDTSFDGKVCGIRYLGSDYQVVVLGFPLYFLQDADAETLVSRVLRDFGLPTGVSEVSERAVVTRFELRQNYPNPFNSTTTIEYAIPQGKGKGDAFLVIYNLLGQRVKVLVDEAQECGRWYRVQWDGQDEKGRQVASGVYICRLRVGSFVQSRKLVLMR